MTPAYEPERARRQTPLTLLLRTISSNQPRIPTRRSLPARSSGPPASASSHSIAHNPRRGRRPLARSRPPQARPPANQCGALGRADADPGGAGTSLPSLRENLRQRPPSPPSAPSRATDGSRPPAPCPKRPARTIANRKRKTRRPASAHLAGPPRLVPRALQHRQPRIPWIGGVLARARAQREARPARRADLLLEGARVAEPRRRTPARRGRSRRRRHRPAA